MTVKQLKGLRVDVDRAIKAVKPFNTDQDAGGREVRIAFTRLQEAKMWLGKALEAQGSKLPAEFRDEAK